ncbi:MAG: hypothetical protein JO020_05325, partial [Chloroflexi bacterium]|nr:hypothetical protein [Chloroflexota bacterium]
MSTTPLDDAPDSLHPPAFVAEPAASPTAVAVPVRGRLAFPMPWERMPSAQRTALGWLIVFALLIALPLADSNGGDLDNLANAGTYVLLALGLNIV